MLHTWGNREMHTLFSKGNLKETDHMGGLDIDRRTILG
jgi:hypothetical protein